MKTITIQIGNSDDKLTQAEWAQYVRWVDMEVRARSEVHFFGTSPSEAEWQNACWVCNVQDYDLEALKRLVGKVGQQYKQDSIAWTEGNTEFI